MSPTAVRAAQDARVSPSDAHAQARRGTQKQHRPEKQHRPDDWIPDACARSQGAAVHQERLSVVPYRAGRLRDDA
jgi:hypothetical protein